MDTELRWAAWPGLEVRTGGEEGSRTVVGLAVPWESLSRPIWIDAPSGKPVREQFLRGAFAEVLTSPDLDVLALRDHSISNLMGRTSSGTLRLRETGQGLSYEFDLPDTTAGRDLLVLLERSDIRGSSFSFATGEGDEWQTFEERKTEIVRTIKKTRLLDDVGPVVRPAYPESAANARSIQAAQAALETWRAPTFDATAATIRRRRLAIAELSG